ncbi:hypothetical protein P4B35_16000 [Pontiellaceae bacterium B12227]|nr:hypothetical protein [Pontiellaceae bacterium B12227]
MLRVLRIVGIVVFAFLIGLSANSLMQMHETGELLEKYNSQRKADITLLVLSFVAVAALGYFEFARLNKRSRRRSYGKTRKTEEQAEQTEGLDSTSIYSAPQTVDRWEGRRTRTSKSRNEVVKESGSIWLSLLKVLCAVLPVLYLGLTFLQLLNKHEDHLLAIVLPTLFAGLFVLSVVTLTGVMLKKAWGLTLGYALAVCNLLIFPIGTAFGLFLIIGLVGSSPVFAGFALERRRAQHHKTRRAPRPI